MKEMFILLIILVVFINGCVKSFDSCSDSYETLKQSDICVGKFEEYRGMDEIVGNIEWFDYNWNEDIGSYGHLKDAIIGPNKACYNQGYRQYIKTGIHEFLIDCFVNIVEIENDSLSIQCGCTFE